MSRQGAASGDFSTAYKVTMNSTTTGVAVVSMNGISTKTVTAVWSGDCSADQAPGDLLMSNGMAINVLGMTRR